MPDSMQKLNLQPTVKDLWDQISSKSTTTTSKKEDIYLDKSIINKYNNNNKFTKLEMIIIDDYTYKPQHVASSADKHKRRSHNDCYFCIIEETEPIYGEIHMIVADNIDTYFIFKPILTEKINEHVFAAQILEQHYFVKVNDSISKYIKVQTETTYLSKLQYKLHID